MGGGTLDSHDNNWQPQRLMVYDMDMIFMLRFFDVSFLGSLGSSCVGAFWCLPKRHSEKTGEKLKHISGKQRGYIPPLCSVHDIYGI